MSISVDPVPSLLTLNKYLTKSMEGIRCKFIANENLRITLVFFMKILNNVACCSSIINADFEHNIQSAYTIHHYALLLTENMVSLKKGRFFEKIFRIQSITKN